MANLNKELECIEQGKAWEESDEVVQLDVKKPLDKVIPIRLQAADWAKLREEAKELGVGPTTLARIWILERLRLQSTPLKSAALLHKLLVGNASRESLSVLTPRGTIIMEPKTKRYENKQIADDLAITIETLKERTAEILQKWESLQERIARGESKQKV